VARRGEASVAGCDAAQRVESTTNINIAAFYHLFMPSGTAPLDDGKPYRQVMMGLARLFLPHFLERICRVANTGTG
jgi:hypothetical protein